MTVRDRLEDALARIADPHGEGRHARAHGSTPSGTRGGRRGGHAC